MTRSINVDVPDIGEFTDIPVISVLVMVGDTVSIEDPLIELESDKATIEVPSPGAGTVVDIKVKEGDLVSEGSLILLLETADQPAKDVSLKTTTTASNVEVPDIGEFTDIPVISVLVKVGDTVSIEDPLIELESDKATIEVPSPGAGTVVDIKVKEGDLVSEGSLILLLETADQPAKDASLKTTTTASPTNGALLEEKAEQPTANHSTAASSNQDSRRPGTSSGTVQASPSVRAFARQLEVDLESVKGSGRQGRIVMDDVTASYKIDAGAPQSGRDVVVGGAAIPAIPAVEFSKFGPVEDVEMSRIKKLSGAALHRSWLNVPHVTHNELADITNLEDYRRELDSSARVDGYRVTLLSFLIKACVSALKHHWEFNSSLHPDGDKLVRKHFYNIGFAADTPNGLVVPVLKDADSKGLIEISKELGVLSAEAREGKLKTEDMSGATFTISSLGGIGGTSFTPIVNAPEVAILGLTRSKMEPVWDKDEQTFVPRVMLPLSLSYDHRAIDGALAARFCATLKTLLGDERRLML